MNKNRRGTVSAVVLVFGITWVSSAVGQSVFTTEDFRRDRDHWTDPAYYNNNSVDELREMDTVAVFGLEGTGQVGAVDLASPYPYVSAWEHYQAWLMEAGGGT